jgi:ABC-type transporter Mla maintaining outer membrane lipid asymmetry ATPase subunit MlaF
MSSSESESDLIFVGDAVLLALALALLLADALSLFPGDLTGDALRLALARAAAFA